MKECKTIRVQFELGRQTRKAIQVLTDAQLAGIAARERVKELAQQVKQYRAEKEAEVGMALLSYLSAFFTQMSADDRARSEIPVHPREGETLRDFTDRRLRRELEGLVSTPDAVWTGKEWKVPCQPGCQQN